jgi:hypothetical protein
MPASTSSSIEYVGGETFGWTDMTFAFYVQVITGECGLTFWEIV